MDASEIVSVINGEIIDPTIMSESDSDSDDPYRYIDLMSNEQLEEQHRRHLEHKAKIRRKKAAELSKHTRPMIKAGRPIDDDRRSLERCCNDEAISPIIAVLRRRPGTDLNSPAYQALSQPRLAEGVEQRPSWSSNPPHAITDIAEFKEEEPNYGWRSIMTGDPRFLHQWEAYAESPVIYPVVVDKTSKLTFESDPHFKRPKLPVKKTLKENKEFQKGPKGSYQRNWNFSPRLRWEQESEGEGDSFCRWLKDLPKMEAVDIYHAAFFDGTAFPTGGYTMMIPDIRHVPAPRNMKHEQTRLHWHETSAGLVYNYVQEKKKKPKNERRF